MKKIVVGICVVLIVTGLAIILPKNFFPPKLQPLVNQNNAQPSTQPLVGNGCGTTKQLFGVSPIPLDKISTIIPLGNFEPHSHIAPTTQVYIRYLHQGTTPELTTIYAPADMTVTQITLFDNNSSPTPFNSYRIDFTLCNEVQGYFILLIRLNDQLAAAFHEPYDYTQTSNVGLVNPDHMYRKNVSVFLKAGQIIGTAGGKSIYPDALDFGLSDTRVPTAPVANPAHWDDTDLHYVCPLDYFSTDIKNSLYQKLGNFDGKRLTINNPPCGQIYQDQVGTAQGLWFAATAPQPSIFDIPNLLTLGHSNFDHSQGVWVLGNILEQLGFNNDSVYEFTPKTTGNVNRDFNHVTPGKTIYCYETINSQRDLPMAALLQLRDANTIRIGKLNRNTCGTGPWQFTTYLDFIR